MTSCEICTKFTQHIMHANRIRGSMSPATTPWNVRACGPKGMHAGYVTTVGPSIVGLAAVMGETDMCEHVRACRPLSLGM